MYRPMDSWWPNGIVFPPQHALAILDYQPPNRHRTSGPAVRRIRPERHSPSWIATLRIILARPARENSSLSFLRIALRLILGIDIGLDHTCGRTRMVRRRFPRTFQQLHSPEFLQDDAPPIRR